MSIKLQQEVLKLRADLDETNRTVASILALLEGEVDPNTPFSIPRKPGAARKPRGGRLPATADR